MALEKDKSKSPGPTEEEQSTLPAEIPANDEQLPQVSFEQRAIQAIEANPSRAFTALIPLFNETGITDRERQKTLSFGLQKLSAGLATRKLREGELKQLRIQSKVLFGLDGSVNGVEPEWVIQACRDLLDENPEDFYAFAKVFNLRQLDQLSSLLEDFDAEHISRYLSNALGQLYIATSFLRGDEIRNQRFFELKQSRLVPLRSWITTLLDHIDLAAEVAAEEEGDPDYYLQKVAKSIHSRNRGGNSSLRALEYIVDNNIDDTQVAERLLELLSSMEK